MIKLKRGKDKDAFISLSHSHFDGVSYKPLDEGLHSPNFSVCEDVLKDIIFEVIKINDKTEHRVAIKKLMEELFRKAELCLIEEVSNLHKRVDRDSEAFEIKIEDISSKITQLGTVTNVI